ncbi:MAG: UMP kinase [Puniceicoccales bacterium]|nr:UMP kinase [Puniceicoccales bacterium]
MGNHPVPYGRILIKISGELLGGTESVFHKQAMESVVNQVKILLQMGIQVGIVLGGGNIYRGRFGHVSSETGDHMGMLATVINGLALGDFFRNQSIPFLLQSAIPCGALVEMANGEKARNALQEGKVVIFSGGTGIPYFSTDTAAALRAIEINADALLKATRVDGIYDDDPEKNPRAHRFDRISFDEVVRRGLNVMDQEAFCLCRSHCIPIIIFSMGETHSIVGAITGNGVCSHVHN